jgi:hypothetical protein
LLSTGNHRKGRNATEQCHEFASPHGILPERGAWAMLVCILSRHVTGEGTATRCARKSAQRLFTHW